jgi:hypothetical protein
MIRVEGLIYASHSVSKFLIVASAHIKISIGGRIKAKGNIQSFEANEHPTLTPSREIHENPKASEIRDSGKADAKPNATDESNPASE